MPQQRRWEVDGQVVTWSDVRRWMQSISRRVSETHWREYVRQYRVIQKIADLKRRGIFDQVIAQECAQFGLTVRAPRTPGALARARLLPAANDARMVSAQIIRIRDARARRQAGDPPAAPHQRQRSPA